MQKVKQSYASKKEPSEAEIDSIDDIISRNDSSKKQQASEQVHVEGPNDVQEGFVHMKNRETVLRDGLFKEEYTSYQPILQVKDDFSEESDKLHHAKFEVAGSSMETNDKLGRDELFGKDISGDSIDLLNKEELMRGEHLINRIYVTCSKSLYRKIQYINECGLLNSYRKEAEPEDDNGVYITEDNRIFKKINNLSADGFTPDEDASAIVDEYAKNLYLRCQNSLFNRIHHGGEGDLENIKELLKRRQKEEPREPVEENILPQERKHTIYIYLHEKDKDKDPDKDKNDWVIYKRIEDRKVKVELLEDVQTMNKLDRTLEIRANFSGGFQRFSQPRLEVEDSSLKKSDKLSEQKLFAEDISENLNDLLRRDELMEKKHLINKIYVTCSKSLYRKMQYIDECGLLTSYRIEAEYDNDNGMYITEDNSLFERISDIKCHGFTLDEDASAIVDEYGKNLYLTCQNSLFKKIHHQGEGDLENIEELLKRKEKKEARESVKEKILPQERKHTIYIYLHGKEKDKDPDKNKNDWLIYKHIKDGEIKIELLEDVQTMNKLDVTAVDSVYKETEEALIRSVLEPTKKMVRPNMEATEESLMKNVMGLQEKTTKSNIKETMKKVTKYGIPGILAMVVLPFLVMEYLKISGASALLETELIAAKAGLRKAAGHIPGVAIDATSCVVDTVVSSMISWLSHSPKSAPEKNDTSCAIRAAEKTVKAMAEGADHGAAVGASIGMSNTWIQFGLEIAMTVAILIIVEVIFQIFLYLDNRGHLDFIDKNRRRFKRFMVEREYKMRKPKSF
ncbi:hypothetical protein C922_05432 [Plasmodium inui San Antonio 1]|uniref:Uncharacterized protein n=1 Tax=Plasmodium inui San Antonio 1 TaxID=1237626 RepID=W6ZY35_9APIC|nr:hypothetical protein C922_05432 [Plasmodium inui San Antonio 1]EUD64195.1 hypothetical protein C922_05432 [Plasmodium inui San Antonio 1]